MTNDVFVPLIALIVMLLASVAIGVVIFMRESKKQDAYRRSVANSRLF